MTMMVMMYRRSLHLRNRSRWRGCRRILGTIYVHVCISKYSLKRSQSAMLLLLMVTMLLAPPSCAWTPVLSSFRPTALLRSRGTSTSDGGDDVMQKYQHAWGDSVKGENTGNQPPSQPPRGDTNKRNNNRRQDKTVPEPAPKMSTITEEEEEETHLVNEGLDVTGSVDTDTEPQDIHPKLKFSQRFENAKCLFLGTGVGILAVVPFTAFHHFVYQPRYTSIPQWEFDTYTAAIQGALFCLTYRYALRRAEDLPMAIPKTVVASFIGVRTLSRIHVPMACTPFPLHCGEILGFASWSMAGELAVNYVESMALFGTVAMAMDMAVERRWIRLFETNTRKK